jgi:hypothetical protein
MPKFDPIIHCYLRQPTAKGKANLKNLVGRRFNRLWVLSLLGMTDSAKGCRETHWFCRCDCGEWWVTTTTRLKNGQSQSCGCWNYDKTPWSKTHGQSKTFIYRVWTGIKNRIYNTNHHSYPDYGGRDITLCAGLQAYEDFYAFVGDPPKGKKSIDRWPNNESGGYWCGQCDECSKNKWPKNIRWADDMEQGGNRRNNVLLTANGETLILSEWARRLGTSIHLIRARLKRGMTDAQALGLEP